MVQHEMVAEFEVVAHNNAFMNNEAVLVNKGN